MIVSRCPICGEYPKRISMYGYYVKIKCKRMFQKPHIVVVGRTTYDAMEEWNKACELLRENIKEHDV